jgi:hypothetical protein
MNVDIRTSADGYTTQGTPSSQQLVPTQVDPEPDRLPHTMGAPHGGALDKAALTPTKTVFPSWHPSARVRAMADDEPAETAELVDVLKPKPRRILELAHVELVTSSFRSFREVGCFQRALASLPDVGSIQVRHLQHGTLQVRVQCHGTTKLLQALAEAFPCPFDVLSQEPHRIEIVLQEAASLAAWT